MSEFIGTPEPWPAYTEPVEHEFIPQPTAWQSLPGVVRVAGWLWAISTITGAVVGVAALVAFVAGWLS